MTEKLSIYDAVYQFHCREAWAEETPEQHEALRRGYQAWMEIQDQMEKDGVKTEWRTRKPRVNTASAFNPPPEKQQEEEPKK